MLDYIYLISYKLYYINVELLIDDFLYLNTVCPKDFSQSIFKFEKENI